MIYGVLMRFVMLKIALPRVSFTIKMDAFQRKVRIERIAHNKRLNSDNVKLSWFWQTTQKAMPTIAC